MNSFKRRVKQMEEKKEIKDRKEEIQKEHGQLLYENGTDHYRLSILREDFSKLEKLIQERTEKLKALNKEMYEIHQKEQEEKKAQSK